MSDARRTILNHIWWLLDDVEKALTPDGGGYPVARESLDAARKLVGFEMNLPEIQPDDLLRGLFRAAEVEGVATGPEAQDVRRKKQQRPHRTDAEKADMCAAVLSSEPMSYMQICRATGLAHDQVSKAMRRLSGEGRAVRIETPRPRPNLWLAGASAATLDGSTAEPAPVDPRV